MFSTYIKYLRNNPEGYWFKAKLYGWGWVPATWQGWAVILGYIVIALIIGLTVHTDTSTSQLVWRFILPLVAATTALILICYKTGEKPGWRWGIKK